MMTTIMTNKTTEALKHVEVWVESLTGLHPDVRQEQGEILAAIREALAEQEKQEPVAWGCIIDEELVDFVPTEQKDINGNKGNYETPLYAAPVSAKREWVETNKALAKEIIEQRNQYLDMLAEAIDLSVKAEREACANLMFNLDLCGEEGKAAAAIRARGEK